MKKVNLLPNVITAFGLACGLFVIFKVNMTGMGTYKLLYNMTLILLLAGIADLLDGAVARAIKAESEFGLVFDSLADAISFGVAPSVLLLKAFELPQGEALAFFGLSTAMIYTICGVLRLVRYNVKDSQKKGDDALKKNFIGLPIPSAAAAFVSPNLLLHSPIFKNWIELSKTAEVTILSLVGLFVGYLMVSKLRFPSLKSIHFKIPSFQLIFFATILACFILYGLLYSLPILLMILSWGYVLLGIIWSLIRIIREKKTKI